MATYQELRQASEDPGLLLKVKVACVIAAFAVLGEAPATPLHAERLAWAKTVYQNPDLAGAQMIWPVLASNAAATYTQITTATDALVQTAVNNAINSFALAA